MNIKGKETDVASDEVNAKVKELFAGLTWSKLTEMQKLEALDKLMHSKES
jgi:hypothetical protein